MPDIFFHIYHLIKITCPINFTRRFEHLFSAGKSLAFLINEGGGRKPEKFFDFFGKPFVVRRWAKKGFSFCH
jgi:hypothetical protein